MSGDVQPRKRKDKKKKKEDELAGKELPPQPTVVHSAPLGTEDVQLHVHKDHGTGGHWCGKIVFFALLAILLGLIGLIILENRGLSDLETPVTESRFSEYFEGWVEDKQESHDEHEHLVNSLNDHEDHDDDHEDDHDDHDDQDDQDDQDDHDDHEDQDDHDDHVKRKDDNNSDEHDGNDNENDDSVSDENDNETVNYKKVNLATENSDENDDDDDDLAVPIKNEDNSNEDSPNSGSVDNGKSDEDDLLEEQLTRTKRHAILQDDSFEENNEDEVVKKESSPKAFVAPSQSYNIENDIDESDESDDDNTAEEEKDDSMENVSDDSPFEETDTKTVSSELLKFQVDDLIENIRILQKSLNISSSCSQSLEDDDDSFDEDNKIFDNDSGEDLHLEKLSQKAEIVVEEIAEPESSSLAVKLIVGFALVAVASQVLVKRSTTTENEKLDIKESSKIHEEISMKRRLTIADEEIDDGEYDENEDDLEYDDEVEDDEDYAIEEQEDNEVEEIKIPEVKKYQPPEFEKLTKENLKQFDYVHPPTKDIFFQKTDNQFKSPFELKKIDYLNTDKLINKSSSNIETITHGYQMGLNDEKRTIQDFIDTETKIEAKEGTDLKSITTSSLSATPQTSSKSSPVNYDQQDYEEYNDEEEEDYSGDEDEEELDEEDISDVDDSDLLKRLEEKYGKLPNRPAKDDGDEEDEEPEDTTWTKLSSGGPQSIPTDVDEEFSRARHLIKDNPIKALKQFELILKNKPSFLEAIYGKALTLDRLSEIEQKNSLLEEALQNYELVLKQHRKLNDTFLKEVASKCIERMRFKGVNLRAVLIHKILIKRFENEPDYRNQLAVTYLMSDRLLDAKNVLHATLLHWSNNGFAQAHYGFVLKNLDKNYKDAVVYLKKGINSKEEGTNQSLFYVALGDALTKLGRNVEAKKVYKRGAENKFFISEQQRSTHNVDRLKSRPFWDKTKTTYSKELRMLENNWKTIRNEGLSVMNEDGYFEKESEDLTDSGDWKQFNLYVRGQKITKNCLKAPFTCKLIELIPAAKYCRRGQVKFSVMHPRTHVWSHCGPTNCRLRTHLGLKIPDGTSLRVADETRTWKEGEILVFDDSFEHEVWHNGTSVRLILIIDVWHPDLTRDEWNSLTAI